MQPGNLVRIKRASIGLPRDTLALLMSYEWMTHGVGTKIWHVSIVGPTRRLTGRFLEGDLELVS
mgnify:CR=1 FL=1|jgi:hypothetical protein